MNYRLEKSGRTIGSHVVPQPGTAGFLASVASASRRDAAKRNFILQQGFDDPTPAIRLRQYSALVFQTKVVVIAVVAGILFQAPGVFVALGALLWWSALFPKLNPISALYNATIGRRAEAFRLGPAPAPRRAAETEAGTIALTIALLFHAGFSLGAYVLEAIFLTAALAVIIGSFCTGALVYHLIRGRWGFVRQTLPWANRVQDLRKDFLNEEVNEMSYDINENRTIVDSQATSSSGAQGPSKRPASTAGQTLRLLAFGYGLIAYTLFLGVYLYAIGFIGDFAVPTRLDSSAQGPIGWALLINLLLLGLFAVQHSVMARPGFKAVWTRIVPKPVERSTYVLFSSLALVLMFAFWQPMGVVIWNVESPVARAVLYGLMTTGFLIVLVATFLINHFDLFGMRQVWLYLCGRKYTPLRFKTPLFYKYVRHPLYVGWLMAFWAAPTMTVAHLVFAVMTTAYILVAIQFEERDLITIHGEHYVHYRREVPMLIPRVPSPEVPGPGKIATDSECA